MAVLVGASLVAFILVGRFIGTAESDVITLGGVLVLLGLVSFVILKNPYLGIVITMATLPIIDILPSFPYVSSSVTLLGGVTLISTLLQKMSQKRESKFYFPYGLIWGTLFVVWVFVSNPAIALFPVEGERNWLFTFIQLGILAFLSANLIDSTRKFKITLASFSIAIVISAAFAIQGGLIGQSVRESIRSGGLSGGANTAARYFIVGLVFLQYLRNVTQNSFTRLIITVAIAIVIFGIFSTVSRTGILLIICVIGMIFLQRTGEKKQRQAILILVITLIVTWVFADNIIQIFQSILPSIQQGTDTVGIRYSLFQAGFQMWTDNVVTGVGIGQFPLQLIYYARNLLPVHRLNIGAHNMYIQVLAEAGLVGLVLFLGLLAASWKSLSQSVKSSSTHIASLAQTLQVVFVAMLIGGITKHDYYDKLLWLIIGVSFAIPRLSGISIKNLAHPALRNNQKSRNAPSAESIL